METQRTYFAIDLKSFYASVECMDRGLDPLTTHLVVADTSRTEKTICLAVSPSLKGYKIPGRARLFEVVHRVNQANAQRLQAAIRQKQALRGEDGRFHFTGASANAKALEKDPSLQIKFIAAPPRMARYLEVSTQIYKTYLQFVSPDDIHPYSIDEVFIDATAYLPYYHLSAHQLAMRMVRAVLENTGITATAGIGSNLYLAKLAMDIVAKHAAPDPDGVRIAQLDELSYRYLLWDHRPLTDFWMTGPSTAKKLEAHGIHTMGQLARASVYNEDWLYDTFGVDAELLIDHAWGWEPCTIQDIKSYRPSSNSVGSGQVLSCPYSFEKARLVIREMADLLALDLVDKRLVTDQLTLTVGYDIENLKDPGKKYSGEVTTDRYGRKIPKHAHGTINLKNQTSSAKKIVTAVMELYDRIMDRDLLIRRMYLAANKVVPEEMVQKEESFEQLDLFTDYAALEKQKEQEEAALERERKMQEAMLDIKKKFGKNAILKGMNLQEGATARDRNSRIGGHKA